MIGSKAKILIGLSIKNPCATLRCRYTEALRDANAAIRAAPRWHKVGRVRNN
jgi:hypothetical protein